MFGLPQLAIGEVETTGADDNFSLAIDLSGITAWTPRHLIFHIRTKQATGNLPVIGLQFNGDTADSYQWYQARGFGSTAFGSGSIPDGTINFGGAASGTWTNRVGAMEIGYAQETNWTHVIGIVVDAFSTRGRKIIRWYSYMPEESGTTGHIYQGQGKWDSTAIITSVELDAAENVDAGSRIELAVVDESYNIDETILGSDTLSKSAWDANDGAFNTNNTGAISAGNGDLCMVANISSSASEVDISFSHLNDDFWDVSSEGNYFNCSFQAGHFWVNGAMDGQSEMGLSAKGSPEHGPHAALIPDYATATHDRGAITSSVRFSAYSGIAQAATGHIYHTRWNNTAAVTEWQIDFGYQASGTLPSFLADSMCSFYKVTDSYNLIERKEITTDTAYFDVAIPDTYDHLEITWTARSDVAGASSYFQGEMSQYLGDSGGVDTTATNYANRIFRFNGGPYPAAHIENTGSYTGGPNMGDVATTDADANVFSAGWNMIFDYNESVHKTSIGIGGVIENNEDYGVCGIKATSWHDNDAVTTLRIQAASGDLVAGSVFSIRGVTSDDAPVASFIPSVAMF